MPIDYTESAGDGTIKAEVVRFKDKGDGVVGVIFAADSRQQTNWKTGVPETWDDGAPIMEYVLNFAAEAGQGFFTVRDGDGKPLKGADGKNQLERRTFNETDVCVTTNYSLFKKCRELRINEGMKVRIERLSPEGANPIQWNVEVLAENQPLVRFDKDAPAPSGIDHDREPAVSPF